jgi:hypothetical protein
MNWAQERWPTPRWSVELDPWQLCASLPGMKIEAGGAPPYARCVSTRSEALLPVDQSHRSARGSMGKTVERRR